MRLPALLRALVGGAALLGAAAAALGQAPLPVPKLEARITDQTGTLTAEQQAALEDKLAAFEARKGSQLAVLIVPTTEPEDIAAYSIRVVEAWKLGRKKVDDGALLIVAKNDRRMRIEVGYGLEGVLTDATSNRIISDTIAPLFRQGDYYAGINAGLDQMIRVIDGEPLPAPDHKWAPSSSHALGQAFPFLLFAVFIVSAILRAVLGRIAGSAVTGGLTGVVVWLISGLLGITILAGGAALLASLLLGFGGRRGWSSLPRGGGWGGGFGGWGGGFGGGFGGGGFGGGGGGFGGGGGGFGGGGASGGW